jgi:hypothetical protein
LRTSSLQLDFRAGVGELLLDVLGLGLGDALLDRLAAGLDQVLRLLEAEPGDGADLLDDVDLLGAGPAATATAPAAGSMPYSSLRIFFSSAASRSVSPTISSASFFRSAMSVSNQIGCVDRCGKVLPHVGLRVAVKPPGAPRSW